MRVKVSLPPLQVDPTVKARFARVLADFSKESGLDIRIDQVHLEAVGHTWEFHSEKEFDEATKLPEVMDRLFIFFSNPKRVVEGLLYFTPSGGHGSWEGAEHVVVPLQAAIEKFIRDEYQRSLSVRTKKPASVASDTLSIAHCELDVDGLKDLAKAILAAEEGEEVEIQNLDFTATGGTLTVNESDLERILDNPALPSPFDEFAVTGRAARARISVSLSRLRGAKAQFQGPLSWVRAKKARLSVFFSQHPNSDPLAASRTLTAGFVLLLFFATFTLIGLTLNRLTWHSDALTVLGWTVFLGLFIGAMAYSDLWDKRISKSWVSPTPRQRNFFRSVAGVLAGLIVSELLYLLIGFAIGWLVSGP